MRIRTTFDFQLGSSGSVCCVVGCHEVLCLLAPYAATKPYAANISATERNLTLRHVNVAADCNYSIIPCYYGWYPGTPKP